MRIRQLILFRGVAALALCTAAAAAFAANPSFDCKRKLNDAERMICGDDALATLDRKLGEVFSTAANSLPRDKTVAYFVAEQRDWVRDRDGCPTTRNPASCLSSVYRTRIAELQGKFHMVPSRGPFRFACESDPPQEIVVTWYATDPPSGILESARGQTTMFETPSGSGTRYVGDDLAFAEHQGTATLAWGTTAQEFACTLKK